MLIRSVCCLLVVVLAEQVFACPIPFHIQSKCRCAITETGRVYIYCARKQLTEIPRFNNSNIIFDELVLSGNRISIVHKNAFNGLKLRKLELQSNPIARIDHHAFIDLANYLEELILSTTLRSSQLSSATLLQILVELPNLKRLSLRLFDLADLINISSAHSLVLRKLTQLSLQSCSISQTEEIDVFTRLFPNLERLDLSENRLEQLDIPFVASFKKLKVLTLSKNKIRHLTIDTPLSPSASLVELDLSYNGIETIEENIFEFLSPQIELLNLRNNELNTERQLTFLTHLSQLREFYLDYNRLEAVSQLQFPRNLKTISLKNNRLAQLDLSIFARLELLEKLLLSSNKLTKVSSKIKHVYPALEVLELDRNRLSILTPLNAPKLKQLNLDGNLMGPKIDRKTFANLPSLERLHLRDNQIELIDHHAFQNTRLQSLDLRNNSLKTVPLLSKLNETLQTLELDRNPLHCDCRTDRNFKPVKVTGQCESPPERRGVSLNELSQVPLACALSTNRPLESTSPTPVEPIRIVNITITSNDDHSKLFVQWQLSPAMINENSAHGINGFKISSNVPTYTMSELLDVSQRNYTIDHYIHQGEICLYLLRQTNYEKFCKQLQPTSTEMSSSSLIVESKQSWLLSEPTKSILIGSIFGILLVLVLLTCIMLVVSRCPSLFFCRWHASKYHQNNDSKSESLLVRPTPTNTIPWSHQSQQHYYPAPLPPLPHHQLRPISYQASLSTQCTCPTHYHSSGTASTDSGSSSVHGQNYHIYQEILNEDFHPQNHPRPCRSSAPMHSEQCQLCSLSVLV